MKIELQNTLFEKYPEIFVQHNWDIQRTTMCWGVDTGDGWYGIIDMLCKLIREHGAPVQATQVKEKYGGLRFYINDGDDYVDGLIRFAEMLSHMTCEQCGSTDGVIQTKGWISTLCKQCLFERDIAQYGGEDD